MTRHRHLVAMAIAMATASCAGPLAPLEVGSKDVPIDLLLGAKVKKVAQAPLPPVLMPAPSYFFPSQGVSVTRPGTTTTTLPVDPGPCPKANPLDPPKLVAGNRVPAPPKAADFTYRTTGKLTSGGANHTEVVLDPQSRVKIQPSAVDPAGNFTFDMTVENAKTETTTTTYRVITTEGGTAVPSEVPPDVPRPSGFAAGIYLARIAGAGDVKPFEPQFPGIQVARLPLDLGTVFNAAGSDGVTTMSWRSTVKEKKNVDACGTPLDSYVIELTEGTITGGQDAERLTFTSRINFGTQYGGLPLQMETTTEGTAAPDIAITRTVSMTVNAQPQAA